MSADRAKSALVWLDEAGKDKTAIISHNKANDPAQPDHRHLFIETTTSPTGANPNQLFTRMEFPCDAEICETQTHSANFRNGGKHRIANKNGATKELQIYRSRSSSNPGMYSISCLVRIGTPIPF